MILIAESGSTKTHWVVLNNGLQEHSFSSSGLNPYTQKVSEIKAILSNEVQPNLESNPVSRIYFYGAGCSSRENCDLVTIAIKHCLGDIKVEVKHDIMAAAVGLFGKGRGIAAILGTGSNACLYEEGIIDEGLPSLGYILGDEGSGGDMGKRIIRDYLYMRLPEFLHTKLKNEYELTKEGILNSIYKKPNPNRWLASFAPFIRENLAEEYCRKIAVESFRSFFRIHILQFEKYKAYPLGAVGSIAYHFKDILEVVSLEFNFKIATVLQSPLEGLIKYHSKIE